MLENFVTLNNLEYKVISSMKTEIVDSFVVKSNKSGTGNGESRLYLCQQDSFNNFFNFSDNYKIEKGKKEYDGCKDKCYLLKENLHEYLVSAKEDYFKKLGAYYDDRLNQVERMPKFSSFEVFDQTGNSDSTRFYIGSNSKEWEQIRELSLPNITHLTITKLEEVVSKNIVYTFLLSKKDDESSLVLDDMPMYSYDSSEVDKLVNEIKEYSKTIENLEFNTNIKETIRESVVKSRIGQSTFRNNTLKALNCCPFTGISKSEILIASHIMPWAKCENNFQRLDGYNGFVLTPTFDKLFDLGYISFKDDGALIISPYLEDEICIQLNITQDTVYNINNHNGRRNEYLKYHRANVFKR